MAQRSYSRVDAFGELRGVTGGVNIALVLVARVDHKVVVGRVVVREERPQLRQVCSLLGFDL